MSYYHTPAVTVHNDTYAYISSEQYQGTLAGKTVLITGSTRGIGRSTALAFAGTGASLALNARSEEGLKAVAAEIHVKNPSAKVALLPFEATPAFAQQIVSEALEKLGVDGIDVLINNAGITRQQPFWAEEDDLKEYMKVLNVNLHGPIALTQAVLKRGGMIRRKSGIVMTTGSIVAWHRFACAGAYGVSKMGMLKFHHMLDLETRRFGIRNYYVSPGTVVTDLVLGNGADLSPETIEELGAEEETRDVEIREQTSKKQTVQLAADTFVALCCDKDAHLLTGKYVESCYDLEEVLADAKKGSEGRISKESLYVPKMGMLWE